MGLPWGCGHPSLTGHARDLLTSLITLLLLRLGSAQLRVEGPGHPVTATVGKDVVLPCHLSPRQDARSLEVRWIRDSISETVHHYRNGEDLYGEQMGAYSGRTELVRDGLSTGSLDLRIMGLRPSDDGQYVCTVVDGHAYAEAIVELEVSATGADPHLSLGSYEAGGVRVLCRSAGWYPLPQLLWRDARGQHLPSVSQTHSQDQEGLFEIEGAVIMTGSMEGPLSCVVRSSRLQQEQESSLHIAAPFFHNAQPWKVALALVPVLFVVFIGLGVYLFRKQAAQSRELAAKKDAKLVEQAEEIGEWPSLNWKNLQCRQWMRNFFPLIMHSLCFSFPEEQDARLDKQAAELEKQAAELAWRRCLLPQNREKVTLDPDTAHPQLVVSPDNKSVRRQTERQQVPDTLRRFDSWCCVLGREDFREGRHCWLVEVEGEQIKDSWWAVGVARASVERKGWIDASPKEGIWAVRYYERQLMPLTWPNTRLSLSPVPTRIWVCLDCTQQQVSFINADNGVEIFTFTAASFNGESIHPWFWLVSNSLQLFLRDSNPQTPSPALGGSCSSPDTPQTPLLGPAGAAQE
ncbi:butyrophilin subfamily 3 member A1-like isoform X3 [Anas acuta]|uniref:butyrophilin subfamily 3 member A1-like isoform X2 n=1 Tax=Anas acuta TaxID=28680 RepID=UPI0035C92800